MNEQELADLFSEQLDRLLAGESPDLPPDAGELQDLLNIVKPATSQTGFHAGSAAQAAFNGQLAGWFGLTTGGSPMTILGLSKVWFLSIVSTIVVVVGGGLIAVIATTAIIFGSGDDVPVVATDVTTTTPTSEETTTAVPSDEPSATPEGTETAVSETPTPETTGTVTPEATGTPMADFPTLIIKNQLIVSSFCGGAYVSQSTLVNYGPAPVTNAALAWNVIEGADFVDQVSLNSDAFEQVSDDMAATQTGSPAAAVTNTSVVVQSGSSNFNQIAVNQDVNLNLAVGVNDAWWDQPDGTVIKVKLSVENTRDHNRGHGNDPDGFDEDNPGRGGSKHKDKHGHDDGHSQIITIVKQGAQWVVLDGFLHDHGNHTFLVDGNVVVTNNCTGLPPALPFGSRVKIIGKLLPDGTFLAINIIIVDIDINIDFDSGVQSGGGNGHGGGDNYGCCGGGGGKGGSKKGGS